MMPMHPMMSRAATPPPDEGFEATAGQPLTEGTAPADEAAVIEALKTVHDPEIPVNIHDLGLIYEHTVDDKGDVFVVMTLTAPACPVAGELPGEVAEAVARVEGVGKVTVRLTWEPPWTPARMSDLAKVALDMF
ncbi:DUF59 domain-containing protein [Roseospirillum parvum]|uniref:FeS assembly SUF system protein n=1 Tax=Roseospirillum parvum TaxID=83401 RepID=A0A1G7UIZ0_9PROT|nr:DUF59 domain-containing protein [Roseospirillum parvum]SDG47474.1 FeS assembly SUF system protein [Roseospirillum parvum]